jgi:hypothetical protein
MGDGATPLDKPGMLDGVTKGIDEAASFGCRQVKKVQVVKDGSLAARYVRQPDGTLRKQ